MITASPSHRITVSFLWGLFLACSWTWCIGMYLPRIMIERFGWPGFIAFAVPNVIGCTAFGYVMRNRGRSEELVARHGGAMTWFSVITVAYHMFFIAWLFGSLIRLPEGLFYAPIAAPAIVLGLGCVFSFLPNRDWLGVSVLVYAVSLAAFASVGFEGFNRIGWHGEMKFAVLAWLTPVMFFGFLLCPYLDLTFHRAIQNSSSRHSFAVFGFAFAIMIVLTCVIWFRPGAADGWLPPLALAHILAQSVFTVGAHLREVRVSPAISAQGIRAMAMITPLAAAVIPVVVDANSTQRGEWIYLGFLIFYGLMFPAYVMMRMRFPATSTEKARQ